MKVLLLILIFVSFTYAEGIDSLLHDYKQESELSKKTKDESAGNLIVYTRDDLERMQVETLKDILKSLRSFHYAENRLAQPDLYNVDPVAYSSKSIRVYLNENELLTAITGSGLILFGDMEMDFIDHVEIYQGFPSFDFGVEPATVVIRLYSKTAEHDEGGRVKANIGSYGANKQNVYYTNQEDDMSYFIYASRNDAKKDTYEHNGETLRRDLTTNRFYGALGIQNHNIELHVLEAKGDAFVGSLIGNVPKEATKESSYINLSTNSKFLNDSLTLNLSYINSENSFAYRYDPAAPVFLPLGEPPVITPVTSFDQTMYEEAFTSALKKEWILDEHTISSGIQYRYKYFDLTDVKFNNMVTPITQVYYKEEIYSIFLQDLIMLNENNLISLSVMDQLYVRDGNVDNQNTLQLRLGYTYSNKNLVSKTFISHQQFASEPYMTISPHYGNPELEPETYMSIFQEFSYTTPQTVSKLILGYGINKNMPILDPTTFNMQNSDLASELYTGAIELTYLFSQKDKLELQANFLHAESPYGTDNILHHSYVIRMLNSISHFDIFNELVINNGYENVDTGYNYSLGVKYELNRDFHINFKGENIFNSGLEWDYLINPGPPEDTVVVPTVERQFTLGMEYLF